MAACKGYSNLLKLNKVSLLPTMFVVSARERERERESNPATTAKLINYIESSCGLSNLCGFIKLKDELNISTTKTCCLSTGC